ncbi:MAG: hypothetical protein CMJ18_01980 [Phycisphaeraceae bacterium]|nr:hypothetical protein [Phycisphaeraceae bacterium]
MIVRIVTLSIAALALWGCSQESTPPAEVKIVDGVSAPKVDMPDVKIELAGDKEIEVGCAMCIYKMDSAKSCVVAADISGTKMLLTGDHGIDPHSVCSATTTAKLAGKVENGKFSVTSVQQ